MRAPKFHSCNSNIDFSFAVAAAVADQMNELRPPLNVLNVFIVRETRERERVYRCYRDKNDDIPFAITPLSPCSSQSLGCARTHCVLFVAAVLSLRRIPVDIVH